MVRSSVPICNSFNVHNEISDLIICKSLVDSTPTLGTNKSLGRLASDPDGKYRSRYFGYIQTCP